MGLLDWLSPALTVGTTAMAAQRNAQADSIAQQQAQAAAQVKAYMDKRKAEDEHAKTQAETFNLQGLYPHQLDEIRTRESEQAQGQQRVAAAAAKAKAKTDLMGFIAAYPKDERAIRAQGIIAKHGGNIDEAMDELGPGYGAATTQAQHSQDAGSAMDRVNTQQTGATSRNIYTQTHEDERARLAREAAANKVSPTQGRAMTTIATDFAKGNAIATNAETLAREVDAAVTGGVNVSHRIGNRMLGINQSQDLMDRTGQGGQRGMMLRYAISNFFGTLAKERGGTALTEGELKILRTYLPIIGQDDNEQIASKMKVFAAEVRRTLRAKATTYKAFGYKIPELDAVDDGTEDVTPPGAGGAAAAPTPPPAASHITAQDRADMKAAGYTDAQINAIKP